jgi:two-component system response regulator VicR
VQYGMEKDLQKSVLVLIIEDEALQLDILTHELSEKGYRVLKATNGEVGLDLAFQNKPDLILLDIIMPRMDGMTVMKKIREHDDWGKKVPIVLLTNLDTNEERLKSITRDQPSYYLVKSEWSISQVLKKVEDSLHHV